MSDYDTVPAAFNPPTELPNSGAFTSFSRHVPALLSGNASEWDRIIERMIAAAETKIGTLDLFSDMLALNDLAIPQDEAYISSDVRVVDAWSDMVSDVINATHCDRMRGAYAVHFSHASLHRAMPSITDNGVREGLRASIMANWRRRFAVVCGDAPLRAHNQLFMPRLAFTGPGVWPLNGSVQLRTRFGVVLNRSWSETAGTQSDIEFIISGLESAHGCRSQLQDMGVLVWIESVDKRVVLSPAALPYTNDDATRGDMVVRFHLPDAGEYRVHIVGHVGIMHEAGARGTESTILPVAGSPWNLVARDAAWTRGSLTRIAMPTNVCGVADLATAPRNGRWVECEAAGIAPESCLSDGWVFVPSTCRFPVRSGALALETAATIAAARGGRPVWIVLAGSSIGRGTLHALVDLVGGLGMKENPNISVAFSLLNGGVNRRGEASSIKCWGWYDVQIGKIYVHFAHRINIS